MKDRAFPLPTFRRMLCGFGSNFSEIINILLEVFSVGINFVSIAKDMVFVLSVNPTRMTEYNLNK